MGRPHYVAGIDVGSTKVCTVIADPSSGGGPRVLGCGRVPSAGMQRGAVVDLEAMGKALAESVDEAERTSGQKIDSAFFNIADEHIHSFNRRGLTTIGVRSRPIGEHHVSRALESTMTLKLEPGLEVLHFVPRGFCVDGRHTVQNPLGMQGSRLEVETHVVSGSTTSVLNTMGAVHRHGLDIDELVVGPLAAAEAVLTAEERHAGVLLVDIGGGTTDIAVVAEGGVYYTGVLGIGANQVTSDLAIGLKTPLFIAEQVKLKHGRCDATGLDPHAVVTIPAYDGGSAEEVPLWFLMEICQARMSEIYEAVMDAVAESGFHGPLPGGVVLTGGGAALSGAVELARGMFELPTRLGTAKGLSSVDEMIHHPSLAVGAGLVLWGMRNGHPDQRGRGEAAWHAVRRRLGTWLCHLAP